jgi:hypothetical protein
MTKERVTQTFDSLVKKIYSVIVSPSVFSQNHEYHEALYFFFSGRYPMLPTTKVPTCLYRRLGIPHSVKPYLPVGYFNIIQQLIPDSCQVHVPPNDPISISILTAIGYAVE